MKPSPSNTSTWQVHEPKFEADCQHHRETIFTLGNGYLSTRGSFEERYPLDRQATLIHGMWDDVPVVFTELANAPDWLALEIWVNGQRFDMRQGQITDYARHLDLRTGVLHRKLRWTPDGGQTIIELSFERFASLADEHILALRVEATPLTASAKIRVRASLNSRVENEGFLHWHNEYQHSSPDQADLLVRTRKTGKTLALCTHLIVSGGGAKRTGVDCCGGPGIEVTAEQDSGAALVIEKITAVATSRDTESPLEFAQSRVQAAAAAGYQELRAANDAAWADFWSQSDVLIEGDDEAQLALRHALFQLRIAAPTHDERVSIGAKTLSGFSYHGHVFWDTEIFALPFFTLTQPELARNMLMYRYHTLEGARRKAAANGFAGAQYAWESAETGDESTPTWVPDFTDRSKLIRIWTGDIQIHISADIAYALHQFWMLTGDDDFWRHVAIPIIAETALFWGDRAEPEGGQFAIRNIIGPDENHDHVDNNAFTNWMVQWHLETALASLDWLRNHAPQKADQLTKQLNLTPERLAHWQNLRDNIIILQDPRTGLFEQFEGFFQLKDVDWPKYEGRTQSMQEILGIEGANEHQVLKQADVIMLLCLLREHFDRKTWQANWDYYNPRTDHSYGSSLGPAMQAWAACEMEQPDLAYEHFMRAARADLKDVRGNANDGIHAASAGGLWQAIAFGFAGLRFTGGHPTLKPHLPSHWQRLAFKFTYRGKTYQADIRPDGYNLSEA
ncbi:MAG: glycoside hydrolase family 65 protein [Chloroflexi bacterium]|nr:glycoside hydrolase family 65 protein [Chloroflexota bacterium]